MPKFQWEGKGKDGKNQKGEMMATSEDFVRLILKRQDIAVSKVAVKRASILSTDLGSIALFAPAVKTRDIVIFTRQFATMINAGLPLVQCLDILSSQTDNISMRKVLTQVKSDVEGGSTFADALKKHPKIFNDLYCNLVAAGEVGGILDTIMNRLAAYMEKNQSIVKKVKSAMTYPIAVVVVGILVLVGMLWKIIPMFEKMFQDMGSVLPAPTQFMIDLSQAFQNHIVLIFLFMAGFVVLTMLFVKSNIGREILDRLSLQLPILGPLFRKLAVAKFTRTMSTMITSGVPILDSLTITSKTAGNRVVERGIVYVREKISEGKNLAEPMAETKVFPSMVVQMIGVGEATGAMDTMMSKIADFYEEEVDTAISQLTSLIEPFIMVMLSVLVGGLVISMYLPIFNLAGNIK